MSNIHDPYVKKLFGPHGKSEHTNSQQCSYCKPGYYSSGEDLATHMARTHPNLNQSLNKNFDHSGDNDSPSRITSPRQSNSNKAVGDSSVKADAGGSRSPSHSAPSVLEPCGPLTRTKRPRQPEDPPQQRSSKSSFPRGKFVNSNTQDIHPDLSDVQLGLRPEDVDSTFVRRTSRSVNSPTSTQTESTRRLARNQLTKTGPGSGKQGTRPSPPSSRVQAALVPRDHPLQRGRYNPLWPGLVLQPESREISQEQLAAEVKSIYTGLTMVETKCIHIDKAQAATPRSESKITDEHWQAMIALHRTLLHEHHDFFLASQHPSASPALKRLALKYSMPARMWKHGIHSFLELLRHRLPESLEYMLAFIYLSYQMMALLYETVDSFRTTWVECLGDLGRYRMAVEDEDIRDREIWAGVARSWYNKAADTNPAIGRLWHHLAILARPHMLQQVYLYNRSLTSVVPFLNARESIVTIFDPVLAEHPKVQISAIDLDFLRINAHLFQKSNLGTAQELIPKYVQQLDSTINELGDRWRETGAFTVIAIIGLLHEFGSPDNPFRFLSDQYRKRLQLEDPSCTPQGLPEDQSVQDAKFFPQSDQLSLVVLTLAIRLFVSTVGIALSRREDKNTLPMVHTSLVFLVHLYEIHESQDGDTPIMSLLNTFHWSQLCPYLNTLISGENVDSRYSEKILFEEEGRPLPEDWMLRGLTISFSYFPRLWFKNAATTEEAERYIELTSVTKARIDRVLSLGARIAKLGTHMNFDNGRFSVPGTDVDMVDEGYESVLGDDSPEMQEARDDEPSAQHKFQQRTAITAPKRLSQQYSAIIAGADVLENTPLFEGLSRVPLPIIVPEQAITDLLQAEKEHSAKSTGAAMAISNLRTALQDFNRSIRIDNDDGVDVTEKYLHSPSAFTLASRQSPEQFIHRAPLQRAKTMQDALEGIVRRETEASLRRADTGLSSIASTATTDTDATEMGDDEVVQPTPKQLVQPPSRPLILTDNKQLRAKADKLGAAALAGWLAKRWLEQGRRRSAASSQQTAMDTAMDIDTTAPERTAV